MIEPIGANKIHEKQLAPHIRRRLTGIGDTTSYVSITNPVTETNSNIIDIVAGEAVVAGKFGHIIEDRLFVAGVNLNSPATCYILSGGEEGDTVQAAFASIDVDTLFDIDDSVYLGDDGLGTTTVPMTGFMQRLGDKSSTNSFRLKIRDAYWWL